MLGCDIIEIERIKKSVERFGDKFVDKILSPAEKKIYIERGYSPIFLAGRFAAKEAAAKALGTGISVELKLTDIEILPDEKGKPILYIYGEMIKDGDISISHSKTNGIAVCII